jgi:predicted small metal-binding protein
MRAVLCALLCNCRHALRADDDERLVGVALDHLRRYHPVAPLREELVKEIVTARAYEIEYTAVYPVISGPRSSSSGTIDPAEYPSL